MEEYVIIKDNDVLQELFGNLDENVEIIESRYNVRILVSGNKIIVEGDVEDVEKTKRLLENLINIIKLGVKINYQKLEYAFHLIESDEIEDLKELNDFVIISTSKGKLIKPKTKGQQKYVDAIRDYDVAFGIGPAGTGKTYLAVCMAIKAFKNKEVNRIIITRPALEAGEKLGFLPGDLQMKVDPYLRPLYDALYDVLGAETYLKLKDRGLIEVAPLAYMRGRSLDNSFIILDEAQNTTKEQMKMFLTRFGFGSKVVVNGDVTQIDLPYGKTSGLVNAVDVLKNVNKIEFVYLTEKDVVRHPLVKKIITSYEKFEKKVKENKNGNTDK